MLPHVSPVLSCLVQRTNEVQCCATGLPYCCWNLINITIMVTVPAVSGERIINLTVIATSQMHSPILMES